MGGGGRNIDGEVLNAKGEAGARYNEAASIWSGSVEDRGGGNDRGIQYRRRLDEDGSVHIRDDGRMEMSPVFTSS